MVAKVVREFSGKWGDTIRMLAGAGGVVLVAKGLLLPYIVDAKPENVIEITGWEIKKGRAGDWVKSSLLYDRLRGVECAISRHSAQTLDVDEFPTPMELQVSSVPKKAGKSRLRFKARLPEHEVKRETKMKASVAIWFLCPDGEFGPYQTKGEVIVLPSKTKGSWKRG